jgi:hypothetical protein
MEESITARLDDTRKVLLESFDEDVHSRLKMRLSDAKANLDRISRMFWAVTRFMLARCATFHDDALSFELKKPPSDGFKLGRYHLIDKTQMNLPGEFLYRLSHPLGEWVIDNGKSCSAPLATVTFDMSNYPAKLSMVEAIKGQSGWLSLQHLAIDSFDKEEYLLFSAFTDSGKSLDQETCERLFNCMATAEPLDALPEDASTRLAVETNLHADAAVAVSLEDNNRLFSEERERLEKWAEDMVVAAEKDLSDTKAQIKAIRRQARLATTLDEQNDLQQSLTDLEKKQRKQRQQIFEIEDQIAEKRDALIDGLQRRMSQKTKATLLFTIQWRVV